MEPMVRFFLRSYSDNTLLLYHDGQNSEIIKNTIPSVQAAETQFKGSFHPTTAIFTRSHNQNASTC